MTLLRSLDVLLVFCLFYKILVSWVSDEKNKITRFLPAMQETVVRFLWREDPWRRDRLPTPVLLGFPGGSVSKESACNAGDLGSISGLGRSPGGGHGKPLQDSCLENLHGQRSLESCSPWGLKELDTTERLSICKHWLLEMKYIVL